MAKNLYDPLEPCPAFLASRAEGARGWGAAEGGGGRSPARGCESGPKAKPKGERGRSPLRTYYGALQRRIFSYCCVSLDLPTEKGLWVTFGKAFRFKSF
jgi:hypothetical protein